MTEIHCHKPNCPWLQLPDLHNFKDAPPLIPNPELSGIGVILGFSITAYLTVVLLVFHYITVYEPCRTSPTGKNYTNGVDLGILPTIRSRAISWKPSRRFEYAMKKSVLILSDAQLVTGLAILIAGYSQLNCGITAYHWQILVFVAWFSTFTFLSAMAFLEGYFQNNNNLRAIRLFFMVVLASLQIAALLPTGSKNWLDLYNEGGGFYPSLSAECYYEQLGMSSFVNDGPRLWSMVFSVLVVGFSYIHSAIKLFDPAAELTRMYLRTIPGSWVKTLLHYLEQRALRRGLWANLWILPYALTFATFSSVRALYDLTESMLAEIIWLAFAIAWGTIKVWNTRQSVNYNYDGENATEDKLLLAEDSWSFGQTLPLVLLLLPILTMAQSYLDNDAKAQAAVQKSLLANKKHNEKRLEDTVSTGDTARDNNVLHAIPHPDTSHVEGRISPSANSSTVHSTTNMTPTPDPRNSTSCSITRCTHHQPSLSTQSHSPSSSPPPPLPARHPNRPFSPPFSLPPPSPWPRIPHHPYTRFAAHPWYRDHIFLLFGQILVLGVTILYIENLVAAVLGISAILRNGLFLIWIFAIVPLASLVHLGMWYGAACIVCRIDGAEDWLKGRGRFARIYRSDRPKWWHAVTLGRGLYFALRMGLMASCLVFTFFVSAEVAGPYPLLF